MQVSQGTDRDSGKATVQITKLSEDNDVEAYLATFERLMSFELAPNLTKLFKVFFVYINNW